MLRRRIAANNAKRILKKARWVMEEARTGNIHKWESGDESY